jgi:hypothetical protein
MESGENKGSEIAEFLAGVDLFRYVKCRPSAIMGHIGV